MKKPIGFFASRLACKPCLKVHYSGGSGAHFGNSLVSYLRSAVFPLAIPCPPRDNNFASDGIEGQIGAKSRNARFPNAEVRSAQAASLTPVRRAAHQCRDADFN